MPELNEGVGGHMHGMFAFSPCKPGGDWGGGHSVQRGWQSPPPNSPATQHHSQACHVDCARVNFS